jgi:hypothetical protein
MGKKFRELIKDSFLVGAAAHMWSYVNPIWEHAEYRYSAEYRSRTIKPGFSSSTFLPSGVRTCNQTLRCRNILKPNRD